MKATQNLNFIRITFPIKCFNSVNFKFREIIHGICCDVRNLSGIMFLKRAIYSV